MTRAPELLTVEWQVSGATVQAEVDVVASRYCTPDEVRSYRADEYQLGETSDEDVQAAIAKAEEVIEHEARRFFQPVIRRVTVDRPRCTRARWESRETGRLLTFAPSSVQPGRTGRPCTLGVLLTACSTYLTSPHPRSPRSSPSLECPRHQSR